MRKSVVSMLAAAVAGTVAAVGWLVVPPAVAVQVGQDVVVSDDPANFTPDVLDGSVRSIQQFGGMILIGGEFSQIRSRDGATTYTRHNLAAFDAATGEISTTFVPDPDGQVTTIIPAGDGTTAYVAGYFDTIGGGGSPSLARIDVGTGARVAGFKAPKFDGRIKDLRLSGGRLWLAGLFTTVAGHAQPALATVDPATGAYDPYMALRIAGTHNGGVTTVMKIDITPDGDHLVAIGNFDTIQGVRHHQAFVLNLGGAAAAVENWQTNYFATDCSDSYQTYMRDLDISPDGSYFVVTTTGAYGGQTAACDTSTRWNTDARGAGLAPRWIATTGGDTTYAVAITGTAVYVGGHQRWQNNPFEADDPGQGAVSRPGIAALDPINGLPLSWNPTRDRGVGVFDLLATSSGLWVGSDTDRIGDYEYHARIAYFPLADGQAIAANPTPDLPSDVYLAGRRTGIGYDDTVARSGYDGTTAGPLTPRANGGVAWRNNRGAFVLNGTLYAGWADGTFDRRSFDGTTFGPPTPVNTGDLLVTMSTWHNEVRSITGLFFDAGRIYYTLAGQSSLYYRYFTPESDVVGALRFTAGASLIGVTYSQVNGMFLAGSTLYWSSSVDGKLRRVGWNSSAGAPVAGTGQTLTTGIDWRSRTLFLAAAAPASAVKFVGSGNLNANATSFPLTVPATVGAGDALLLFFADNDPVPTVTGPVGWTPVETVGSTGQAGRLWHKTATAADAGSTVRVTTSAYVKGDATLLAYRGTAADPVAGSAAGSETVSRTTHTTPTLATAAAGGKLVSYWAEKSSATTTLAPPVGTTSRAATTGTGSGRITALTVDSDTPVASGTVGGLTATADTASARTLMFTVVLATN